MDVGLKHLKVIGLREDGGRKRVPVPEGHRDKRFIESVGSFLQFHEYNDFSRLIGV